MQDLHSQLNQLRRPRLLIRTARIAAETYRRDARLPRILGYGVTPRFGPALMQLMKLEDDLNSARTNGDAGYSVAEHVDVLTAIMGEAQLLRAQLRPRLT